MLTTVVVIAVAAMPPSSGAGGAGTPAEPGPLKTITQSLAPSFAPPDLDAPPVTLINRPRLSERTTVDLPDTGDHLTHLVYFVPKDQADEGLDTNGVIANSMRSIRSWFVRETGNLRPRMDLSPAGGFDITFVAGAQEASAYVSLEMIVPELKAVHLDDTSKRYLIYAEIDRDRVCGESYYPWPVFEEPGQYAVVYLDSREQCGARDFGGGTYANAGKAETIAAHEWLHNDGVAPAGAPHYCLTSMYHVCTGSLWVEPRLDPEAHDIVFPWITDTLGDMVLDRDHDDYFDHEWSWLPDLRDSPWFETV